jgi:hypothetical protein
MSHLSIIKVSSLLFTFEDEIGFVDISVNAVFKVNYSYVCTTVLSELSLTDVYQVFLSILGLLAWVLRGCISKGDSWDPPH